MAKASTRFRNRKINFKTRISIKRGIEAIEIEEDINEAELELDSAASAGESQSQDHHHSGGGGGDKKGKDRNHVETGVDKEEEHELHLQAVIASSSRLASSSHSSSTKHSKAVPRAYIPTPDSTGTVDLERFRELYPGGEWMDPMTYVRFSDTVEDSQRGSAGYTMDEEDEDWLEGYNASCGTEGRALEGVTSPQQPSGRGAREKRAKGTPAMTKEGKGKEVTMGPLGEDEFELVMELFEKVTEDKAPMAHVDTSLLPSLGDMDAAFGEPMLQPSTASLRGFARFVYPHWKERRLKRQGKAIIPQLDYDESNESNPYVCFRRRELKTSRKTRRSDAQNVERLIRLRNDLFAAHALMLKTRDRERLKLEAIEMEKKVFEGRCAVRDLKRRLGEAEGDEDILVGRREKRRKKEDVGSGMRISIRKPDSIFSPSTLITSAEELKLRKDRAATIMLRMERDLSKRKETDQSWEDWTDTAFVTRPPPWPARFWRPVELVPGSVPLKAADGSKIEAYAFVPGPVPAVGHVRTSFRRRMGRGGRVMLDRIAPGLGRRSPLPLVLDSDESDAEEDEEVIARREERFRYDSDSNLDFPSVDEPAIIDNYEYRFLLKRSGLLKPNDIDFLAPDHSYLEQSLSWVSQEPEKPSIPPTVFGRPPPRPVVPVQPGGPGGVPLPGQAGATYQQMQLQAQRVAQQAAVAQQQKRLSASVAGAGSPEGSSNNSGRKTSSNGGSPVTQVQPLALPMQIPPVQGQWMNGTGVASKQPEGVVLPPGFPNHIGQQLPNGLHLPPQRLPNGLVASLPNGANGLPATSRLSAPPFSSGSPLSVPLPSQSGLQLSPGQHGGGMSSPGVPNHLLPPPRPGSASSSQAHPPSRPSSAQSSHHSPQVLSQGLPISPSMQHATNGKRPSPNGIVYPIQAGPGSPAAIKQLSY